MKIFRKEFVASPVYEESSVEVTYIKRYMFDFARNFCINFIEGDDSFPHLHNHPWDYFTLIIWGGYFETVNEDGKEVTKRRGPGYFSFRKYSDYHRIRPIGKRAITLFWRGKMKQPSTQFLVDGKPMRDMKYWMKQGYSKEYVKKRLVKDGLV